MTKEEALNMYMESFMKMTTDEKEKRVLDNLVKIVDELYTKATNEGYSVEVMNNKELNELSTHDDYLASMMIIIKNIENIVNTTK